MQETAQEPLEHLKITGLVHAEILEELELEQNRLSLPFGQLIEKLLEIMGQLPQIGRLLTQLDRSFIINILFIIIF
jgi:hypothetical protein